MQKNLKLLIVILVILSGLLAVKSYLPQLTPKTSPYKERIKDVKKETVTILAISKQSESVKLVKEGEAWKAEGKKADKSKVEDLINGLITGDSPELISQTDTRHTEFELTSDLATQVKINDGLTVFLGKAAAGGGMYARFDGDNNVYLLKNLYSSSLSPSLTYWVDKTIFAVDKNKLKKLEFRQNKKNVALTSQDNKWTGEKTNAVLTSLSSMIAENLVSNESARVYPSIAQLIVTAEYEGGKESLSFYQGKNDYKLVRDSDKEEFVVTNSTAQKFLDLVKEL